MNLGLWTFFSIIFAFVAKDGNEEMQTNSARQDDGENAELRSVYLRARRPEEAALTCVNDLLGTEEGDFHCNNRSCIVLYPL